MRRLLFLVSLLVLGAVVATGAYLLIRGTGTKVTLRSPLAFQQVTASHPGPCANGELVSSAGTECYTVGKGFSVDRLKALAAKPPSAQTGGTWTLDLELYPADAAAFGSLSAEANAAYSKDTSSPGGQIAMVFQREILSAPQISGGPITSGRIAISGGAEFTREYANALVDRIVR